jgi:hypothetical protein
MGKMTAVAACASITVAYLALQPFRGALYVLSNTSEAAFSLIPLLLSFYVWKTKTPFIKSTRWLAIGFLMVSLGEVTYSIYALFLGIAIPYPSIADFFWLSSYPLIFVGIAVFLQQFRFAINRKIVTIAISISAVVTGLIAVFLIIPVDSISPDLMTSIVGLAYPILSLGLLFTSIVGILMFRGGAMSRGWRWLALGSILFAIADIGFSYFTATGSWYDGHPFELLFDYGYVCFGLSLYSQLKDIW